MSSKANCFEVAQISWKSPELCGEETGPADVGTIREADARRSKAP